MRRLTAVLLLFIVPVAVIVYWPTATQNSDEVADFLATHWQHPIAPQGVPPTSYTSLESSLDPKDCGSCHAQQYQDWQKSLHSQTMTAGVMWQFRLMGPQAADACLNCHAPLAEQRALLAIEMGWPNAPASPPPAYVPENLAKQGLSCAACHVRQHQRFGPEAKTEKTNPLPHNGFTESQAFSDGKFCATCHQFPDNGPRTAGKLREDTWNQWQLSPYGKEGKQCQSCHMPNKQHHWQGIHSPAMVMNALSVESRFSNDSLLLALRNSGAGHDFPTYMVPKVDVKVILVSDENEEVLAQTTLGWHVDVSLENEWFDTRIKAGDAFVMSMPAPVLRSEKDTIKLALKVRPREHYERTYLSVLDQHEKLDQKTLAILQQAYDEALATHFEFILWQQSLATILANEVKP